MSHSRTCLLAACLLFTTQCTFAQRPYLRAGAGWAFPFLTQTVTGDGGLYAGSIATTHAPAGASSTDYRLTKASFGAGGSAMLAGGIFLTDHIGVEMAAHIGFLNRPLSYTAMDTDPQGSTRTRTIEARAERPIILCPALVLRAGGSRAGGKRAEPYARIGPALPLHTARVVDISEQYKSSASFNNYTITAQAIEQSRFSVGLSAALGVSIPLWPRAALFAECNATALQVYIRKRTYTSYFFNSEDVTDAIPESLRTTWYETNYTDPGPSATGNSVRPAYAVPFSSLGIIAGLSVGW